MNNCLTLLMNCSARMRGIGIFREGAHSVIGKISSNNSEMLFFPMNTKRTYWRKLETYSEPDERLLLFVTRMQNLFLKLTSKRPTEEEQVSLIKKRLLPNLQTALAFQEIGTIDELLRKIKVFELVQWQASNYTPPPISKGIINEPHLIYKNSAPTVKPVGMTVETPVEQPDVRKSRNVEGKTPSVENGREAAQKQVRFQSELRCWRCDRRNCVNRGKRQFRSTCSPSITKAHTSDNRPIITVEIGNKLFKALLDTEATRSFLNCDVAKHCDMSGVMSRYVSDVTTTVADVPQLPVAIVLGMDVLAAHNFRIDLRTADCFLNGKSLKNKDIFPENETHLQVMSPSLKTLSYQENVDLTNS
ncbi:hypothetical protein WA026_023680 [Henosepilachna vigintioctopunctata]|uniref:Gag-pol polyprotein n=1 Tax=Henosepilachna vigintioctopunctata TaxID=420089 RepID=A0AAW1U6V8_9CUCU